MVFHWVKVPTVYPGYRHLNNLSFTVSSCWEWVTQDCHLLSHWSFQLPQVCIGLWWATCFPFVFEKTCMNLSIWKLSFHSQVRQVDQDVRVISQAIRRWWISPSSEVDASQRFPCFRCPLVWCLCSGPGFAKCGKLTALKNWHGKWEMHPF